MPAANSATINLLGIYPLQLTGGIIRLSFPFAHHSLRRYAPAWKSGGSALDRRE